MTMKSRKDDSARFSDRLRKVATAEANVPVGRGSVIRRQRADRKATFKAASLRFVTGERIEVIVKNISTTGARIEFMRNVLLPDRVFLSEPTARLRLWAYVAWQEPGAAGLEFVRP